MLELMFAMVFLCWNQFAFTNHLCFNKKVMWWWEKAWHIGMFLWVLFPEAAAGEYWRQAKSTLPTFFFFFPETKCVTSVMQIIFNQLWGLNMGWCLGESVSLYLVTEHYVSMLQGQLWYTFVYKWSSEFVLKLLMTDLH